MLIYYIGDDFIKRTKTWYKNHREINGTIERFCNKCKEWKPETTDYFYLHNKSKPEKGFQSECKICASKRSSNNQSKNEERRKEYFYNYYHSREEEQEIRRRQWRSKKRDHIREYTKGYINQNPDKSKKYSQNRQHKNHDITENEWQVCLKVFNYKCAYCGMSLDEHLQKHKEKFHKEHFIDDGYNDIRNCVPACKNCNSQKWKYDVYEWYPKQDFFSQEKLDFIHWWINDGYKQYIEPKPPYRIKRSRKYNEDETYEFQHELWSVDEKRNFVECIYKAKTKKEVLKYANNYKW